VKCHVRPDGISWPDWAHCQCPNHHHGCQINDSDCPPTNAVLPSAVERIVSDANSTTASPRRAYMSAEYKNERPARTLGAVAGASGSKLYFTTMIVQSGVMWND